MKEKLRSYQNNILRRPRRGVLVYDHAGLGINEFSLCWLEKKREKGNTKNERERQRKKERQKKRDREPYMQLTACFSFIHDKGPSKEKKIVRPRSHKS